MNFQSFASYLPGRDFGFGPLVCDQFGGESRVEREPLHRHLMTCALCETLLVELRFVTGCKISVGKWTSVRTVHTQSTHQTHTVLIGT